MSYDAPWNESIDRQQGRLEALAPNLWWVWSLLASPPMPRNMVVVRLPSGGLLLHSPICLPEEEMARLDALGPVELIVVPNEGHRIDSLRFRKRYPGARVLAPFNARKKVERVVPVDACCEEVLPGLGIGVHLPRGMKQGYELVYEVDLEGGGKALIVNDVLGCPHDHFAPTGLQGWVFGLVGVPGGGVGQARIVRFFFGKDAKAFKRFVEQLAEIEDLRVVTTSHGSPLLNPAQALREAAARM
jgi:hypothetical protein